MPTSHKITIASGYINASLQVGDVAYKISSGSYSAPASTGGGNITYSNNNPLPVFLGTITKVQGGSIFVQDMADDVFQNDIIMFSKNIAVNKSGLKGYFAEVTLKNESPLSIELFSIASGIDPSSK